MKLTLKQVEANIRQMTIDHALDYLYQIKEAEAAAVDKLIQKFEKKKQSELKERTRFENMCAYEKAAYSNGTNFIAGVDEAGRGPLAGPVVAAAVILPQNVYIENLNDSKKLTAEQRDMLYDIILEKAVACEIGVVDEKCIDELNILNATIKAMETAVNKLKPQPDHLLVDAVDLKSLNINKNAIIKGDALSISIAAASIIAKVTRDRMITEMDNLYPQYGFAKHKGYGTAEHINAIKKYGICPIHRMSFTKNFLVK